MLNLDSFRERLHQSLSRLTPEKIVGASGLAILCAASTLALTPPSDQAVLTTLIPWLGGLGLNVLAGILQQEYQNLLSQPARDEQERLIALSEALTKHIRRQSELRREIGSFLGEDNLDAFRIAQEVVQGNPAVHGWLLVRIYQDVTEYRADFDQIHRLLAEMKSLIEQLQQPVAATHETEVVDQLNRLLAQTQRSFGALGGLVKDQDDQTKLQTLQSARGSKEAFFNYFDEHRIHLPQNLCDKLDNLHQVLDRALTDYELSQAYDHTKDSEAFMYMHRGFETITERIPQIRQEIEQEFRQLIATGDRHTDTPDQSPAPDAQVEFSYRLISTDYQSDEHAYQLEVTVENQGSQAINNFKLEFTFPDFDSIPKRWEVIGTLGTPVSSDTHQTSGSLVEISPRDDSVSIRRGGYLVYVTFRSQDLLFPDEKVALGEMLGLRYRINKSVYENLREMPPLQWALYADNMPRKHGEVPISELNVY